MYSTFGDMGAGRNLFDEWPLRNVVVWTALINGYAKKGDMIKARQMFDSLPERDSVTWSAVVAGYVQNRRFSEGLELFREMILQGVEPTEGAQVSALSACANLGALNFGRWIHSHLKKESINRGTALVDMYAKCGELSVAVDVFEAMETRNIWTWNAMIGGFALHGFGQGAAALLSRMLRSGFSPDKVTFLGLLCAFSHSGKVNEGKELFNSMESIFKIEPELEHYACLVDILARAGSLEEAKLVVQEMPVEPDAGVWGALLGGCRFHGSINLGAAVGKKLLNFDPGGAGRYILLSNIFAAAKQWEDARSVRDLMVDRGLKPQAGISSVEISGVVHEFVSGDKKHYLVDEIYRKVDEMMEKLGNRGYSADTGQALLDLDEEDKEIQLAAHSERLAIAFALIALPDGVPIRVVKNLRVCADCHAVTKLLSEIYKREIIVRDRKRFHRFERGSCSCNDFW